jgi:VanZ family protein
LPKLRCESSGKKNNLVNKLKTKNILCILDTKKFFLKKYIIFISALLWFCFSVWLFTLPGSAIPQFDLFTKLQGDKLIHALIFLILSLLFLFSLKIILPVYKQYKNWYILLIILICCYGLLIEFIQEKYIPYRSYDIGDVIADVIGSIIAFKIYVRYWAKK